MNLLWLAVIILLVLAIVGAPGIGPVNHPYGWGPTGVVGVILIVLLILLLLGRL